MSSKACSLCDVVKPLADFGRDAKMKLGVRSRCRECCAKIAAQYRDPTKAAATSARWRAENPERVKASRAKYATANREQMRTKSRARYAANRDAALEYQREWRAAHKADRLDYNRRWREANPEKWNNYGHERRARQRETSVGPIDLKAIWTGQCALCGDPIDPSLKRPDLMSKSVDHIVPLARGGTHTQGNVQWAHLGCNFSKGARTA